MQGRAYLIVGATGGIGREAARQLVERGAMVALLGRDRDALEQVTEPWPTEATDGHSPLLVQGDAANRADVERAVEATVARFGRLDGVVHAAGLGILKPAMELTDADLDDLLTANLKTAFVVAQVAGKAMAERGGGSFVALPGILGRTTMRSAAGYCAAKFALVGLLKTMALELQRQNVRFSLLYLGGVDTPFWDRIDLRVQRDKMLRAEDAAHSVVQALDAPPTAVLGELVLQPESHQL